MILIAGLGNPGGKFQKTRHNVGFLAIDGISFKYNVELKFTKKFNTEIAEINDSELSPETVLLVKPQTFMNNSGEAIEKITHFYKISPENCWIIFDELDLPLGVIKIRKSGSAGTHNGMKSIVGKIGKNFPRFRIGIESRGVTASKLQDTQSFVMSSFFETEKNILIDSLERVIEAIETALQEGLITAMNKYN